MKKIHRLIASMLAVTVLTSVLSACHSAGQTDDPSTDTATSAPNTSNSLEPTDNTAPAADVGEPVEVSSEGHVEWILLGVRSHKTFAGVTAADGKTLVTVYLEARNKSTETAYIPRACLETNIEPIALAAENIPAPYDNFGGYLASGTRRLFVLCFEMETEWFKLNLEYDSFDGSRMAQFLLGKNYREETEMLQGNPAYPIDDGRGSVSETQILADFDTLYDRYYAAQWGTPSASSATQIEALLEKSDNGLRFTNVNYQSTSASAWDNANHLIYLKNLISAYGEERLKNDGAARETALSVLDYWLNNDFHCSVNWWYNEIQTPRYMAAIGLMLSPYLSEAQVEKMDEIIGRGTLRGSTKSATYTGANLSDMMATTIVHALFIGDYDLLFAAVARISAEVVIAREGEEGMQADGSYFQHGTLLCAAGSYGAVFVQGMRTFITQLQGTCFQLPQHKIELFIDHILDGQRYFHRAKGAAYFSIGRSAVYASGSDNLYIAATMLSQIEGIYRGDELKQYAESFADFTKSIDAHRYFPLSYSLVRTRPEYYMAVRGAHEGFILTEVVNRQNLLGYNLSYGANTCYMYYGDEYQAIGAVLDQAMFPGITTYHESDSKLLERFNNSYANTWGKATYTGTHCDGLVNEELGRGALYMELKNDGITGKLSFITYDGGMIALGAGLNCSKSANTTEIRTSLDQCKLNGARVGDTPLTLDGGDVTVTGGEAVCNGAFAYYNLGQGELTATAKRMTGSYSRTDSAAAATEQTADVFGLYLSHGTTLQNGSYAYAVVGNADGTAPSDAEGLPIKNITNTADVQAVEFTDGHAVIVFHTVGTHTLTTGETVTATEAGIVIR